MRYTYVHDRPRRYCNTVRKRKWSYRERPVYRVIPLPPLRNDLVIKNKIYQIVRWHNAMHG